MASSLKRRHDESAYSVAPLSEYQTGQQPQLSTKSDALAISDEDRVNSPHNLLEAHRMFTLPVRESKRTLSFAKPQDSSHDHGEDAEKRVTIWNWREQRKLSGNSAPFKKNLQEYIRKHPDWEEYVGQDKDTMTGKKLSSKKMIPPAPRDANHPYYHMAKQLNQSGMPPWPVAALAPAPQTSYGTRSSHSRARDVCSPREVSQHLPQAHITPANQNTPINVVLESPAAVAMRRSVEMAARRKAMQAEVESALTEGEKNTERARQEARRAEEAARDAAWKAATAAVAQQQEEKLAARRKVEQESLQSRQSSHAEQQDQVVGLAMSRILAFKKRRIEGA